MRDVAEQGRRSTRFTDSKGRMWCKSSTGPEMTARLREDFELQEKLLGMMDGELGKFFLLRHPTNRLDVLLSSGSTPLSRTSSSTPDKEERGLVADKGLGAPVCRTERSG